MTNTTQHNSTHFVNQYNLHKQEDPKLTFGDILKKIETYKENNNPTRAVTLRALLTSWQVENENDAYMFREMAYMLDLNLLTANLSNLSLSEPKQVKAYTRQMILTESCDLLIANYKGQKSKIDQDTLVRSLPRFVDSCCFYHMTKDIKK